MQLGGRLGIEQVTYLYLYLNMLSLYSFKQNNIVNIKKII